MGQINKYFLSNRVRSLFTNLGLQELIIDETIPNIPDTTQSKCKIQALYSI